MSWVEVDGAEWSWVDVDGAGWSWVHGLVIPTLRSTFFPLIEFRSSL